MLLFLIGPICTIVISLWIFAFYCCFKSNLNIRKCEAQNNNDIAENSNGEIDIKIESVTAEDLPPTYQEAIQMTG